MQERSIYICMNLYMAFKIGHAIWTFSFSKVVFLYWNLLGADAVYIYMFWGDFFALWEKFGCVISSQVFCRNVQSGNLDHPFYKEPAAIHQQNLCIWMFGQTYSGEWSETRVVGKTLINFTYVQGATSAYIYILVRRVAFGNGDVAFLRVFV